MKSTTVERPLEWMRFDPVMFGLLTDGLDFTGVGAITKAMLHLWQRGPLSERDLRRVVGANFDAIRDRFDEFDGNLSLAMVEEARAYGQRSKNQRSEAGKASAAKRNERSTTVEQPLNESSTSVLSMSMSESLSMSKSSSSSKSKSSNAREPEIAEAVLWPTFTDWWELYDRKADRKKCEGKWNRLDHPTKTAIMEHTRLYVTQGRGSDPKYRRDPATYLNNENWNDDELTQRRISQGDNANLDIATKARMAMEANAEHYRRQREHQ